MISFSLAVFRFTSEVKSSGIKYNVSALIDSKLQLRYRVGEMDFWIRPDSDRNPCSDVYFLLSACLFH